MAPTTVVKWKHISSNHGTVLEHWVLKHLDGQNCWRRYASRSPLEATLLVLPNYNDPGNMLQFSRMCKAQVCLYCTCTQSVEQVERKGLLYTDQPFLSSSNLANSSAVLKVWKYIPRVAKGVNSWNVWSAVSRAPHPTFRDSFRVRHVQFLPRAAEKRVSFKSHSFSLIMWLQNWSVQH